MMKQRLDEIGLIARCMLADDRQAFGALVDMHTGRVKRFLANLAKGDAALVDDLAQETFIKAYMAIKSFRGMSSFATWLYRIAYNEYVMWSRRRRDERLGEMPDVADETEADSRIDTLMGAIDRLDERQKAVIVLHYVEDQPVKKIARIMDMPEGTVKVYLMRGRENLKKFVKDER